MQPLVEPGSFVWGFVSGAAFTFVGVMTWALCASAKMGDRASEKRVPRIEAGGTMIDAEAVQYEQAESMGRDLPPAA